MIQVPTWCSNAMAVIGRIGTIMCKGACSLIEIHLCVPNSPEVDTSLYFFHTIGDNQVCYLAFVVFRLSFVLFGIYFNDFKWHFCIWDVFRYIYIF